MLKVKQRKKREFDEIESASEAFELFKTKFQNRKIYLQGESSDPLVQVNEFLEDSNFMLVTDSDVQPVDGSIQIYGLLDKYVEFDLEVVEQRGPGYFLSRIKSARKAVKKRSDLRFKLPNDEVASTNFKVSKHTIDVSSFKVPTTIKVILDQIQSQKADMTDIVKVSVFTKGDYIFDSIRRTGNTLFIEDVTNPESYKPMTDDFLDLGEHLGDELDAYMKKNIEKGYKSIIICPLIYVTEDERSIPFAYIQAISKSENFTLDKVLEIKDLTFRAIDTIRDANTLVLTVHQSIVNVSKGGTRLCVTDPDLKKYIIHQKGFIFDIVFKLQAPITIYGDIKYYYSDGDGNLMLGIDFTGNSSRKDEMRRFNSIINPMEADYKKRLLSDMEAQFKNKLLSELKNDL